MAKKNHILIYHTFEAAYMGSLQFQSSKAQSMIKSAPFEELWNITAHNWYWWLVHEYTIRCRWGHSDAQTNQLTICITVLIFIESSQCYGSHTGSLLTQESSLPNRFQIWHCRDSSFDSSQISFVCRNSSFDSTQFSFLCRDSSFDNLDSHNVLLKTCDDDDLDLWTLQLKTYYASSQILYSKMSLCGSRNVMQGCITVTQACIVLHMFSGRTWLVVCAGRGWLRYVGWCWSSSQL